MIRPQMLRFMRVVSMGVVVSLLCALAWDGYTGTGGFVAGGDRVAYVEGTAEQRAQVDRVLALFSDAGVELPPVMLVSYHPLDWCPDHIKGRATPSIIGGDIDLCFHTDRALAHEVAHLALYTAMTATDRSDFTERRGLKTWSGREWQWQERATEHAANLLVWWVLDHQQGDYVYWKIRAEDPCQDLADLAWLLEVLGLDQPDRASILSELRDPSTELLLSAAPLAHRLGRRPQTVDR